jgi:hypothetical protein
MSWGRRCLSAEHAPLLRLTSPCQSGIAKAFVKEKLVLFEAT